MHKNNIGIGIFIGIGAIVVISMNALTVSWIFLDPFIMAQTEHNPNNSSTLNSISENSTITSSSNQSVTFYRFVDNLCTNTTSEGEVINKGFLTYLNPYYGIVIDYPSNWTYKESNGSPQDGEPFSIVTFSPPLSSDQNAETNLRIWVENLKDQTVSLDEYAKNVIKSYRENNSNFSLIRATSNDSTIANGYPAYSVEFTDDSDNLRRKSIETGTISNVSKSAYYITFNTDESLYNKFNPLLKRMIESFGIYDYQSSLDEEKHGKTYIQGYNDGLDRMIAALCHSPTRSTENADNRQ